MKSYFTKFVSFLFIGLGIGILSAQAGLPIGAQGGQPPVTGVNQPAKNATSEEAVQTKPGIQPAAGVTPMPGKKPSFERTVPGRIDPGTASRVIPTRLPYPLTPQGIPQPTPSP